MKNGARMKKLCHFKNLENRTCEVRGTHDDVASREGATWQVGRSLLQESRRCGVRNMWHHENMTRGDFIEAMPQMNER